jgi:hypothetical protein
MITLGTSGKYTRSRIEPAAGEVPAGPDTAAGPQSRAGERTRAGCEAGPGDWVQLRGLPCVAEGVQGAMFGTRPDREVIRKLDR